MRDRRPFIFLFLRCTFSLFLLPSLAAAQARPEPGRRDAADLSKEVERLKKQVADLSRQVAERRPAGADESRRRRLKIGLVDIVRAFDELDEKIDMNAEITEQEERRRTTLRELLDNVKNFEEKLKVLNPESDEAKAALRDLEQAKRQTRAKGRALDDHIYKKLLSFTRTAYKKINNEIRECATERGYDVVLRIRDPNIDSLDPKAPARSRYIELNRRIEYRSVLYARSALDFTPTIIKRLNKKYAAEQAAKRLAQPDTQPKNEP